MKIQRPILLCTILLPLAALGRGLIVPEALKAIEIEAGASTGLNGGIYVLPSTAGVRIGYESDTPVSWQRFSNLGAAYAEDLGELRHDGNVSYVELGSADTGLVVSTGGVSRYFWIVNYQNHELELTGLGFAPDQDCDRTALQATGKGNRIDYYTINGRREELSRELEIDYTTLRYDESSESYRPEAVTATVAYLQNPMTVEAPLCDTDFRLSGDRFLRAWNLEQSVTSDVLSCTAVSAETFAVQTERDVPNEQKDSDGSLGGSAPCEITFTAVVSDAAVYREWQISTDPEFGLIDLRYNELEVEYTFRQQGTSYVRFVANNAAGTCEYISPTYEVSIGVSALRCPNAFTPFTSPGVNDEWRVSYKSLIDFECHIFNKWGTELFKTTDPAIGWDGKYGGKYVPAGTYYYVIRAEGSDGKKYKLSGDINIIGQHGGSTGSAGVDE